MLRAATMMWESHLRQGTCEIHLNRIERESEFMIFYLNSLHNNSLPRLRRRMHLNIFRLLSIPEHTLLLIAKHEIKEEMIYNSTLRLLCIIYTQNMSYHTLNKSLNIDNEREH